MKTYIGIDPGKSGALALLTEDGQCTVVPFHESAYITILSAASGPSSVCCLEKVGAMPGQGVVSMFNFGHNLGYIEGLLQAFDISYQLVPPQTWKKEFCVTSDKNTSIEVCRKLFPHVCLLPTARSRKPSDGMAEAMLMAEYARRRF